MKTCFPTRGRTGFTLIELLIVVAIIAILAAIAVPNFQEALVRCRVARVKSDLRTLSTALESYRTDNTQYPRADINMNFGRRQALLTTPIAYLSGLFDDPFFQANPSVHGGDDPRYCYCSGNIYLGSAVQFDTGEYRGSIFSVAGRGPDGDLVWGGYCLAHPQALRSHGQILGAYDPTNGTVSKGDIFRTGGSNLGRDHF